MTQLFWNYSYLQVLDFLTTIAFLLQGVKEGNPLVRIALTVAPNPIVALLAVKLLAVMLGVYCLRMGRERLLLRMNILFSVLIAWNLLALIVGSLQRHAA